MANKGIWDSRSGGTIWKKEIQVVSKFNLSWLLWHNGSRMPLVSFCRDQLSTVLNPQLLAGRCEDSLTSLDSGEVCMYFGKKLCSDKTSIRTKESNDMSPSHFRWWRRGVRAIWKSPILDSSSPDHHLFETFLRPRKPSPLLIPSVVLRRDTDTSLLHSAIV